MVEWFSRMEVEHYAEKCGLSFDDAVSILVSYISDRSATITDCNQVFIVSAFEDRAAFYTAKFSVSLEDIEKAILSLVKSA
jgi:hypothetical protein